MGVLVLNDSQIKHTDYSGIAVAKHFNVWDFGSWLLSLLEDLSDTGEVSCGTCLINSGLENLSSCCDKFVSFRI